MSSSAARASSLRAARRTGARPRHIGRPVGFGLVFLAAVLAASSALAQTAEGSWVFETAAVNANCKLSGDMNIWKTADGALACRFVALQSCTGEPPIRIRVAQTCTARQTGAKVEIASRILRTVSVSPPDLKAQVDAFYAPDNFFLALSKDSAEMTGLFRSLSEAFVRFRRRHGDLVS